MADVVRADSSSAEWWMEEPEPKTRDNYEPQDGALALEYLAESLEQIRDATDVQDYVVTDATRCLVEGLDVQGLVDTVAMVQDLRRSLAVVEAYITREVGLVVQEIAHDSKAGQTSDGRPYEIMRGANRKAWDHDGWKRRVRARLIQDATGSGLETDDGLVGACDVVNAQTGEAVDLYGLLDQAQQVHGSAAPKTTVLKRLGVDPDDYCETHPGPFAVKITTNRD